MLVKNIVEEDFVNYKLPSMFIATCFCDWKCCREQNLDISVCQNSDISKQANYNISNKDIFNRYISNPITKAVVIYDNDESTKQEITEFEQIGANKGIKLANVTRNVQIKVSFTKE